MQYFCDVIIPVYKGLDEIKECLESVLACSGAELHKILLVNDCSPSKEVCDYIYTVAQSGDHRIQVIQNEKNIGYLRTCNKAIALSNCDVVLLNSDTVVTEGWLAKMLACAYSRDNIATVSPFTNSGILCSVPVIGEENRIPSKMCLADYAQMIEKISEKAYPVLPSSFGFCMLIKRSVLKEIGMLDEIYNKGYYEENDFCCRARGAGYDNVLCDDTYIYHKGSVSFSGDKFALSDVNEKIILKRYPNIIQEIRSYMDQELLSRFHLNILLHTMLWGTKRASVFFVLHKSPFEDAAHVRGGVEYHVADLIKNMKEQNYFVFYPTEDAQVDASYTLRGKVDGQEIEMEFLLKTPVLSGQYHRKDLEELLRMLLTGLRISCVHIHHLMHQTCDIVSVCEELNIPYYITLHDFYMLCPNYTLQPRSGCVCGMLDAQGGCVPNVCVEDNAPAWQAKVRNHRKQMKNVLQEARRVFVPSDFLKRMTEACYDGISCDVMPHWSSVTTGAEERPGKTDKTLRIAFLGAVSKQKGSDILKALMDSRLDDVEWHIFGAIGDEEILPYEENPLVYFHGIYRREEIVNQLKTCGIDIVCHLSQLPETYGFTLTEAWLGGCPVISTSCGAVAQRVGQSGAGWVLSTVDPTSEILEIIHKVQEAPELLAEKIAKIEPISAEQMKKRIQKYYDLYSMHSVVRIPKRNYSATVLRDAWTASGIKNMLIGKAQDTILSGLVYSTLYLDEGDGFCEEKALRACMPINRDFTVRFEADGDCICNAVRFDIVEGYCCLVKIQRAKVFYRDGSSEVLGDGDNNGRMQGDCIKFEHKDPSIVWSISKKPIDAVEISGKWFLMLDQPTYEMEKDQYAVYPTCLESKIYLDRGEGYSEKNTVVADIPVTKLGTTIVLNLAESVTQVRFDPVAVRGCRMKINRITLNTVTGNNVVVPVSDIVHNGREKNGWIEFDTDDPWVEIKPGGDTRMQGLQMEVQLTVEEKSGVSIKKIAKRILKK
ncbi:MAG: glycosyltransferase [Christensenella sp.]|nr:glycosyltransferase [Christensenella sp.]